MCTTNGITAGGSPMQQTATDVAGATGNKLDPPVKGGGPTGGLADALAGLAEVTAKLSDLISTMNGETDVAGAEGGGDISQDIPSKDEGSIKDPDAPIAPTGKNDTDVAGEEGDKAEMPPVDQSPIQTDPTQVKDTAVDGEAGSGAVDQTAEGGGATDAALGAGEVMPELKEVLMSLIEVLNKLIEALTSMVGGTIGGGEPPIESPGFPEGLPVEELPEPEVGGVEGGGPTPEETGFEKRLRDEFSESLKTDIKALEAEIYPSEAAAIEARKAFFEKHAAEIKALDVDTEGSFTILEKIPPAVEGTEEWQMLASPEAWYQPHTGENPAPEDPELGLPTQPADPGTGAPAPGLRADIPADLGAAFTKLTTTVYGSQEEAIAARDAFLETHNDKVFSLGLSKEFAVLPSMGAPGWTLAVGGNNWIAAA